MKRVSNVILLCLMVLSISVEAGGKRKKLRRSPCARFFAFFSLASLFNPQAQAQIWEAPSPNPHIYCYEDFVRQPLHEAADACNENEVYEHLKNSGGRYKAFETATCEWWYSERERVLLPGHVSAKILARATQISALKNKNYELAQRCTETLKTFDDRSILSERCD